jgi:ATP-dependent DNA helicase RecG
MTLEHVERLIAAGESESLELKKSTGQLTRAAETLCAFLNAAGGTVILGVTPEGKVVGQQVSDKTQQDIAGILQRFEPPAPIGVLRVSLPGTDRELLALTATPTRETLPFTFDGRPYRRGSR